MKPRHSKITDNTLFVRDAGGEYRIAPLDIVIERARTLLSGELRDAIFSPESAKNFFMVRLAPLDHEVFACLFLNAQHKVIAFEEMFRGTIDAAAVHPREVVKSALGHNAAAVVFTHNHPSGLAEPSEADRRLTQLLKRALETIDIRVLDHIVVGGGKSYSFAEHGLV